MKPVLGVAEVGRIRVTDQRSRVSRRTRGEEEALGPIESAYREQKRGTCLPSPPLAPLFPFVILLLDSFFLSFSLRYNVLRLTIFFAILLENFLRLELFGQSRIRELLFQFQGKIQGKKLLFLFSQFVSASTTQQLTT